jgi:hypothetical protein
MRASRLMPFRFLIVLLPLCLALVAGCSRNNDEGGAPNDFVLVMDVASAKVGSAEHVNIRIDAGGEGRFERYDSGGVIRGDESGGVIYGSEQVLEHGEFRLSAAELALLWEAINDHGFFALTGDYRMAMGHVYAFIRVEGEGRGHQVFNIGMEVPEIEAIVAAVAPLLPEGVSVTYRRGP